MSARKSVEKRLEALERKLKAKGGKAESMVIGLVDKHRQVVRTVRMVGRAIVDVTDKPEVFIPQVFEPYLMPAMRKVARGGRASAKTHSFIRMILLRMQATRTHVGCFREIQKSIKDSIKQTIEVVIEDLGIKDQFYITDGEISCVATGSKMVFAGLYRNIVSIKGMDWIDIAFCEEAENISEESWNILIPTLRKPGAELMVCYNPKNVLDATHLRFGPGKMAAWAKDEDGNFLLDEKGERIRYAVTRQVNYTENPYFSSTSRIEMEKMKADDYELYEHIWLGQPNADSELAIIKPSWISAAIDAHIKLGFEPEGEKRVGQDVADGGKDSSALVYTHGSVVLDIDEWRGEDTEFTACRAYSYAREVGADMLVYDSIGVGAGVKATVNRLRRAEQIELGGETISLRVAGFNAGGEVINKAKLWRTGKTNGDMFYNVKAQAWWALAERFRKTFKAVREGGEFNPDEMISLPSSLPHLEQLRAELSRPRVDYGDNGKVQVESKAQMKKRQIPSPNLADALVMCYAPIKNTSRGVML